MKTTTFILITFLISTSIAFKIRVPAPVDPFTLTRSCDAITPQISAADLLAVYSQDVYQSVANLRYQLYLVRHEINQMSRYSEHRIAFKMNGGGATTYIALKIRVSGAQVDVVIYVQAADFGEVANVMGFPNNEMYSYPCGNLSGQCAQAFVDVAEQINVCPAPVMPSGGGNTGGYNDGGNTGGYNDGGNTGGNNGGAGRRRRRRRRRRQQQQPLNQSPNSPFQGGNPNSQMTNPSGDAYYIGSSRPRR